MRNPVAVKSVVGTLVSRGGDEHLQYKGFSFGNNFGVVGWFYSRFLFTLQRRSPPGQRASGEFIVDFHVASTGRHSTDDGAHYAIVLLNGSTPLRTIDVGRRHVPCGEDSAQIQSLIPDVPDWADGFPLEFFDLVNSVRMEMVSGQDSC